MASALQYTGDYGLPFDSSLVLIGRQPGELGAARGSQDPNLQQLRSYMALLDDARRACEDAAGSPGTCLYVAPHERLSPRSVADSVQRCGEHETRFVRLPAFRAYGSIGQCLGTAVGAGVMELERLYNLRSPSTVWRFLAEHPQVLDVLMTAVPHLRRAFGLDVLVALQVVADPEAQGAEMLFGYIGSRLSPQDALRQLGKFEEEWFLEQFERVGDLFSFTL